MANTKVMVSMIIFIVIFELFVGMITVSKYKDLRIESNLEDLEMLSPVNSSGGDLSDEDIFWNKLAGSDISRYRRSYSVMWSMLSFKVFGLPSAIGVPFHLLIISTFIIISFMEVSKFVRGI